MAARRVTPGTPEKASPDPPPVGLSPVPPRVVGAGRYDPALIYVPGGTMTDPTTPPMPNTPPPAPRRNRTNAIIIGSAAAVIAAIITTGIVVANSRDDDSAQDATVTAASPEPAATTEAPSPKPSEQTFKFGKTADISIDDRDFSATVLAFKDKGINGGPGLLSDGQKWALLEVKVCNRAAEAFPVSPFAWSLAYGDGARVEPTHISGGELPGPIYPMDAKVKGGDCVRGNVTFQVPLEGRAERALYSPSDLDEPVEWQIGK